MKHGIQNVLELKKGIPLGLRNPLLQFVVSHAMNHVVETFVLEVEQASTLLNQELKRQGLRALGTSDKHYRHLKKIRNKLVAHKIENSIATTRYKNWYKRTYGNFESVLALVQRVGARLHQKIAYLESTDRLKARTDPIRDVPRFGLKDIEDLLAAMRAHGIY